jgi:hypothetical protein
MTYRVGYVTELTMTKRMLQPALAFVMLLGGCAAMPSEGMRQMRPDATPYDEAHKICWVEGMGAPMGGSGEFAARQRISDDCMRRYGWEHKTTIR